MMNIPIKSFHAKPLRKENRVLSGFLMALLCVTLSSCDIFQSKPAEKPIARVGKNYLYPSELPFISGPGVKPQDSLQILENFIEKWVRKQLMLNKAELNLSEEEKDVSLQLEEYRTTLLIFKYQQMLLRQQLDTSVSTQEIEEYFTINNASFVLNKAILKGLFLQVPREAPDLYKVRNWARSGNESDVKELDSYAYQYAKKYEYLADNWTYFENIAGYLPGGSPNMDWILRTYKFYEVQDSTYTYMLAIKDFRMPGSPAPIDLVENDIRNILLNKRKIEFLKKLENDIYSNAMNRDLVEIY